MTSEQKKVLFKVFAPSLAFGLVIGALQAYLPNPWNHYLACVLAGAAIATFWGAGKHEALWVAGDHLINALERDFKFKVDMYEDDIARLKATNNAYVSIVQREQQEYMREIKHLRAEIDRIYTTQGAPK